MWSNSPQLVSIVNDELIIAPNDLSEEISANTWLISADIFKEFKLSIATIVQFFVAVKDNRIQQIKKYSESHQMILYFWFDTQARQLRFSLTSGCNTELPFGAPTKIVALKEIVQSCLTSTPISIDELEISDFETSSSDVASSDKAHHVEVYCLCIP